MPLTSPHPVPLHYARNCARERLQGAQSYSTPATRANGLIFTAADQRRKD